MSLQPELGPNTALSSSQGGVSLVFHVNDGPDSLRLPQSFFVSRCASLCLCLRKVKSNAVNVEQRRSSSQRLWMAWRIGSICPGCIWYSC